MADIIERNDIIEYIGNKYAFLEFEDLGRGPRFDCWGFVREVYRNEKGIELPSLVGGYDYSEDRNNVPRLFHKEIARSWIRVSVPQPMDCVVFNVLGIRMHVGIMLSPTWFIHMVQDVGVGLEELDDPESGRDTEGFYRHVSAH